MAWMELHGRFAVSCSDIATYGFISGQRYAENMSSCHKNKKWENQFCLRHKIMQAVFGKKHQNPKT